MTKRQVNAEKLRLRGKIFDMLTGAAGGATFQDDGDGEILITASIGLEQMSSWMKAIRNYCDFVRTEDWPQSWTDEELKERAFHFDNLRHFDTLSEAADHLYGYGFRA